MFFADNHYSYFLFNFNGYPTENIYMILNKSLDNSFIKIFRLIFFSCLLPLLTVPQLAKSNTTSTIINKFKTEEYQQKKEIEKKQMVIQKMKQAKIYLINGNMAKAKRILLQVENEALWTQKVSARYLGLISFIEGDHEMALHYYNSRFLYNDNEYKKNCILKILSLIILGTTQGLLSEFNRCHILNFQATSNNHLWLEGMVKLKLQDPTFLRKDFITDFFNQSYEIPFNILRVILKLAIFLNRENTLKELLFTLPQKIYENSEIRELIGFIFYRLGMKEEAFNFLEDITSPNAENIKGNLRLEKKEYELAFGHFQLALKKKQNSANAIERSIPLAYILKQWENGIQLVKKIHVRKGNLKKKLSLLIAFQVRAGHYKAARNNLLELKKLFQGKLPREVLVLYSYNSLLINDAQKLKKYSDASCRQYDALNCWILLQSSLWENLSKTLLRKDKTHDDKELTLENLKEKIELDPLEESIYIQQRDIEEMDDRHFKLKF